MTKFNVRVEKLDNGTEVHLLTRGNSKPITDKEFQQYKESLQKNKPVEEWTPVCGNKVFLTDLRLGLEHCSGKYGVSEETIQAYITKKIPHINPNIYRGTHG